jgi:hypothetical protein
VRHPIGIGRWPLRKLLLEEPAREASAANPECDRQTSHHGLTERIESRPA